MTKPGATLKSRLRQSVIGAYRSRGRGQNNLWLVTSVKNNNDWILPSDRQFIHWLACLETNPDVLDFDLAPELLLSHDSHEQKATQLDAVVTYRNHKIEWHEVKAGRKHDPKNQSQFLAQAAAASKEHAQYRIFNDSDLKPLTKVALRWLKPLAYANALRGQEHSHYRALLVSYFKRHGAGNIGQVLHALPEHDSAIVLGMVSRLAIQGVITLDLNKYSFGLLTPWRYRG
jgi:hypothetical protein